MADEGEAQPLQLDADEFNPIRQLLMNRRGYTEEEATLRLQALLGPADQDQDHVPPPPPAPPSPSPPPQHAPLTDDESQFPSKKKVMFVDFDLNSTIPEWTPHSPDPHAVARIKAMEYVELWYFTTEGIKDASQRTPTAVEDAFGLLKTDAGITFQPIKTSRASQKVIQDEALPWEKIMSARHNLLLEAFSAGWPEKIRVALSEFYVNLEALGARGKNPRVLVLYHAIARRRWHAALKGLGQPFNLSNINGALFTELENQIRESDNEEFRKQASFIRPFRK